MSVDVGDRVAVCGDDVPRSPAVVIDVDTESGEAVVVFDHHDPGVWVGLDDRMRREVVEVLLRGRPDYFDKIPTHRYPLERLHTSMWYEQKPRSDGGGESV